jgi:hypothetical protein
VRQRIDEIREHCQTHLVGQLGTSDWMLEDAMSSLLGQEMIHVEAVAREKSVLGESIAEALQDVLV